LSENPAAIHLLAKNQDKLKMGWMSSNPAIFEYDYEGMSESRELLHEELISVCYHPDNFTRLI